MCKKEDVVFRQGCVEKNNVCASVPSAFVFGLKWWFLTLGPGWQLEAGSEQASVKESGGTHSSVRTPEGVCFAPSGGVMRVTKVLALRVGWQESLCELAVWPRGPEHHGLMPAAARAVWAAGVLIMCSMQGTELPKLQEFTLSWVPWPCSAAKKMACMWALIHVVFSGQMLSAA